MIHIHTDKNNLSVKISFQEDIDNSFFRKIVLLFSAQNNLLDITNQQITIPWTDFNKLLFDFSSVCKSYRINVKFDKFSEYLIEKFLEDRKYRKEKTDLLPLVDNEIKDILVSKSFSRNLTDEQKRDTRKLLKLKHGANFSVPGAGKTTTLLAIFTILKHFSIVDKLFVISPKNAFMSWEDEVRDIFNGSITTKRLANLSMQSLKEAFDQYDVILINYEKMRKELNGIYQYFEKNKIHLVLDESHRIKSGDNNLSFSQIDKLASLSIRRDILSGTPLPQSYADLQPQLYILWRENLLSEELINSTEDVSNSINHTIKDLFVRTTKDELGLNPPTMNFISIEMGPIQSEIYSLLRSELTRKLSGLSRDQILYIRSLGSMAVRLMQAATNPMLLSNEDEYFHEKMDIESNSPLWEALFDYSRYEKPAKFNFLESFIKKYLSEDVTNKIVLWTYFVKNIRLLEKRLSAYNPTTIYGAIHTGDIDYQDSRESRIRRFHLDENCRILIANPQACGEGISLHKASHHAIYLDRNFNAAYYLQSVDRIHRLGLSNKVETNITFLIAKDTIDEVIVKRLNEKTKKMADVLNDQFLRKLAMDPDDILFDESLGLDGQDVHDVITHLQGDRENER